MALIRIVLIGILLLSGVQLHAEQTLKFRELYGRGGTFSPLAQRLDGTAIRLRGFMAPPLLAESRFFVLTKLPMSVCPFCEDEAEWPEDILWVETDDIVDVVEYNMPIYVTGTLELGTQTDPQTGFVSRVRLVDAEFEKAF